MTDKNNKVLEFDFELLVLIISTILLVLLNSLALLFSIVSNEPDLIKYSSCLILKFSSESLPQK